MLKDHPLYLFSLNSILIFIQMFFISYIINSLLEDRMSAKKNIKMMIFSIIYGAFSVVFYYIAEIGTWQFNLLLDLYGHLLLTLFLILLYPAKKKKVFYLWIPLMIYISLCSTLLNTITTVLIGLLEIEMTLFILAIWYIIFSLLMHLLAILIFIILKKTNHIVYVKMSLDFPRLCIFWLITYVVISVYSYLMEINTLNYLILMLVIAISIFICMLTARDYLHKEKIKQNEALILQQEHYVKRLENIQQELRMIQHDYKNMISALYAQANDGDTDSIKDFIETKLIGIDAAVQENINQMNQVSKIELSALKGLVLTKIIEAEKKGVLLKIEVINTVSDAAMEINDLIRCVGILLDNALEAAQNQDKYEVALVLLSEPDKFTVAVKNPIQKMPDLSKIWQDGYSTKGKNRGLGLTSYKKILNKYSNISCDTKVTDDSFFQTLIISNAKNDKI